MLKLYDREFTSRLLVGSALYHLGRLWNTGFPLSRG
jgi:thiazole synthase ThiGH ThiG subunit